MDRKKVKILEYNAIFQKEEDGGYSVWIPDLPGCTSQGETFEKATENIQEAMELYLESEDQTEYESESRKQFMAPVHIQLNA